MKRRWRHTENGRCPDVHHAAVAEHGHAFTPMRIDDRFHARSHPAVKHLDVEVVAVTAVDEGLPGGVVLGLELLQGDVVRRRPVVFGEIVSDDRLHRSPLRQRRGGLDGPAHRARVDRVDPLAGQPVADLPGLAMSRLGESGIGAP